MTGNIDEQNMTIQMLRQRIEELEEVEKDYTDIIAILEESQINLYDEVATKVLPFFLERSPSYEQAAIDAFDAAKKFMLERTRINEKLFEKEDTDETNK